MANTKKTVILENISRRLHVIGGVNLAPTMAAEFPEDVLQQGGVKMAMDLNELKIATETKDPITTEEDAQKELERRSSERAGKGTQASQQTTNGAPAAKVNAGK